MDVIYKIYIIYNIYIILCYVYESWYICMNIIFVVVMVLILILFYKLYNFFVCLIMYI